VRVFYVKGDGIDWRGCKAKEWEGGGLFVGKYVQNDITQRKVHNLRVKDALKCLYMKKQQLIRQIYHLHILLANTWGNTWLYIQQTIEGKPKKVIQLKYKNLNRLVQEQTKKTETNSYVLPYSCKQQQYYGQ